MSVDTWRLFFDNLIDRPNKLTFTGTHGGAAVAGHGWQRSVDGSRNTTYRIGFHPDSSSIEWDITWDAGDEPTPIGGQWAIGLFNHNLRLAGATSFELQVSPTAGGSLFQVLDGYFADMPIFGAQDFDYIWLSDQTTFILPVGRILLRVRFVTGAASMEAFIGQVMVCSGYVDTDGGPLAPTETDIEALRRLGRTASGDPAVTPALSQSQLFTASLPVADHTQADLYQKLITTQRNALPYAIHPHTVPANGTWRGPGTSDQDVEGKGMAWMVTPRGSRLAFNLADRYSFALSGLRQKGLDQWE